MQRYLAGLLSLVVAVSASRADAATPAHVPVRVETDFGNEHPAWVARVRPLFETEFRKVLQQDFGIVVSEAASSALVIHVRSLDETPDGAEPAAVRSYGARLDVQQDGATRGDKVVRCAKKSDSELVACALAGLPEVIAFLPEPTKPAQLESSPAPSPAEPAVADVPGASDAPPPMKPVAPVGPAGFTGIALGAAGLATAIAGGIQLQRGLEHDASGDGRTQVRDYRPQGRVLLGTGLGLFGVGAVLLAVDVAVRANKRKRQRTARFSLDVRSGYLGATARGYF